MSVPAVPEPDHVVVPLTGEVVSLDDPAACGKLLREIRRAEGQFKDVKRLLTQALVDEAQRAGTKTLRLDGVDGTLVLRGGPESETVWDVEILRTLLDMGLPPERFNELVSEEVAYKVNANVAKSIAAANPDYARVIEAAKTRVDKPWQVS